MAMNFGKSNRSIAFNPTSAFPLDARGYFESYEAAVAAALLAKEVGSTETVYYYGQTLVVVENEIATLYLIQPDNTLKPIEGNEIPNDFTLVVDEKVFTVDAQTGKLGLNGFEGAAAGSVATIGADGSISWTVPVDAYSKTETEERIAAVVAESSHLKRKIVANIEEAKQYIANNDDADQYIYMVPTGLEEADDKYDEYMIVEIAGSKVLEKVGSWEVDLRDYAKKIDLDNYVEKVENARLITLEEALKLKSIEDGAEKNIIHTVSSNFTIGENRELILNPIAINQVSNLEAILNSKVDIQAGHRLINPTEIEKLSKLVIEDDGGIAISAKVNIENVQGLEDWLNSNAATTPGLSENNLTDELFNKLTEQLLIKSINTAQLSLNNGHLSVINVDYSQVTGLDDILALKATQTEVNELSSSILNLEGRLNAYSITIDDRFIAIEERLAWHNLA